MVGIDRVAGQGHLFGASGPDQPGELLRQTPAGEEPDPDVGIGEARLFSGDENVTAKGELEPTRNSWAIDSADHRLFALFDRRDDIIVENLRAQQASGQSIRRVADQLALEDPTPPSPFRPEGGVPGLPFAYQLPAAAPVTEGLASVNVSGVRSRGLTLDTARGVAVNAPADGVVKFVGPFHDYDGVIIVDHGGGWLSLIVNVGSTLKVGDRIRLGDPIGRALGPLQVELSQNGRRISPAIIAGSSQNLSKGGKGG